MHGSESKISPKRRSPKRVREVLLSIPGKIILFLASYGLGPLSKIYNRHLYEECRVETDVRGWVARYVYSNSKLNEFF